MSRVEIQARIAQWLRDNPASYSHFLANPRRVMAERLGIDLPPEIDVEILLEDPETLFVVLPHEAERGAELTDQDLDEATAGNARVLRAGICYGTSAGPNNSVINLEASLLI